MLLPGPMKTMVLCRMLLLQLCVGASLHGCATDAVAPASEARWVAISLDGYAPVGLPRVAFDPPQRGGQVRVAVNRELQVRVGSAPLTVRVPGYCPVSIPAGSKAPLRAQPLVELPAVIAQVGFGVDVRIGVTPGCEESKRGKVSWRQVGGPPVDFHSEERGFRLRVRTPSPPAVIAQQAAHGIVPISAAQQGKLLFEATYRASDGQSLTRRVRITSIARATGLPTVSVGQQIVLAGPSWTVSRRPPGSRAVVVSQGPLSTWTADRRGRYELKDLDGCLLKLTAGRHNEVPYDCGRGPCHGDLSQAALDSPMSRALQHIAVDGRGGSSGCVPDCHYTGEAGLSDGGFVDTALALGFSPSSFTTYNDLPPALRRVGGVRCTDCHGPAAIPPENDRAQILAPAVCATCHDDPPGLLVVSEWRAGRMSHADQNPATRAQGCMGCHTTAGFLARLGVRPLDAQGPGVIGVACAACHAAHGAHGGNLVRSMPMPPSLETAQPAALALALCSQCHAPLLGDPLPQASAAALVLGSVRLPAQLGGTLLTGPATHVEPSRGCLACHGTRAKSASLGVHGRGDIDHAFATSAQACKNCHTLAVPDIASLQAGIFQRATEVWERLLDRCGISTPPLHGEGNDEEICRDRVLYRAQYGLALVLRDPAAAAHNLAFARQLIQHAERSLTEQTDAPR